MSTSTRILRNTSFLYIKIIVSSLVSLYTARVFLNVLGASDYGLYNLMASVIFTFSFFQALLTRSTLRYLCYYKGLNDMESQKRVFSISFLLHIGIAIVIVVALPLLAIFFFSGFLNIEPDRVFAAKWVYYLMIVSFVFTVLSVPYDSVLNANENMFYDAIIGISESILRLMLALILPLVFWDKLIFFSIVICSITVISLTIKRVYCHLKYKECKVQLKLYDKKLAKEMISYAGWNFTTAITSIVSFSAMPVLLNIFWGTLLNAAQGVANQVNSALTMFSSNLLKAINPVIMKSGGNDVKRMHELSLTGSKLSFSILSLFAVAIIVECPYILKIWLNNVPDWTVIFCELLLIRSLFNQMITVYIDCIYASKDIKNYCIIKSVLNILPLFIVYFLFSCGSAPYSLYIVMFICWELFGGVVALYYNNKMYQLNVSGYIRYLALPCIADLIISLLGGYAVTLFLEPSLERLILNVVFTFLLQLCLVWYIILDQKERLLVKSLINSAKEKVKIFRYV